MSLEISLPFGRKNNVKNLVFSILINEYPLKIIELTNYIRKRYGKSVTFQGVRKAVIELVSEGVLERKENSFSIDKDWIKESKETIDRLYIKLFEDDRSSKKIDSIEGDVTVLTFDSLNELMKYWQNLVDDWFCKFKKGQHPINCYQAAHVWEVLLHPDKERKIMEQLKKKKIRSYSLTTTNTDLDRLILKFYKKLGIVSSISATNGKFDKSYYVGTYGDLIVQVRYPDGLVKRLEQYFKGNTSLESLDLKELSDIVTKKVTVKLTIIRNLEMAKQINQSIISQIE